MLPARSSEHPAQKLVQRSWLGKEQLACRKTDEGETMNTTELTIDPSIANDHEALLRVANALLRSAAASYSILGDSRNLWPGRFTAAGQSLLVDLRDSVSDASGVDAQ